MPIPHLTLWGCLLDPTMVRIFRPLASTQRKIPFPIKSVQFAYNFVPDLPLLHDSSGEEAETLMLLCL